MDAFIIATKKNLARKKKRRKKLKIWLRFIKMKQIQQQINIVHLFLFSVMCRIIPDSRRYWITHYQQNWFESIWQNRYEDIVRELWKNEFHISAETFQILVDKVSLRMQKQDTRYRNVGAFHVGA